MMCAMTKTSIFTYIIHPHILKVHVSGGCETGIVEEFNEVPPMNLPQRFRRGGRMCVMNSPSTFGRMQETPGSFPVSLSCAGGRTQVHENI
jgi:hypothetical protein